jgi:D-alanyl-D-alanine carboxypeptidase
VSVLAAQYNRETLESRGTDRTDPDDELGSSSHPPSEVLPSQHGSRLTEPQPLHTTERVHMGGWRRRVKRAGGVVILLFGTAAASAIPRLSAQVVQPTADALAVMDQRIRAAMAEDNIPGVLIGVASRGRLVHTHSYGMANVELSVPVSDSTVFEIGSISKQFVSTAIMLLVEDGRVDLDDGIHRYLADLPSEWLGVTIRQLLTHTSGIPDYEEIQTYEAYRFRFTPEQIIRVAHSRPMDFEPGMGWFYSNTGYFLLSLIVERVEGHPLGRVLQSRIFEPLGMTQTRLSDPEDIIRHRASGYWVDRMGVKLMNRDATQPSSTLGAGGILSSVHDMVKWDEALYGDQFLSEASKTAMWESTVLPNGDNTGYAFGWSVGQYRGHRSVSHNGQVAGFVASFVRLLDEEAGLIVFANRYRVSSGRVLDIVAETFLPN